MERSLPGGAAVADDYPLVFGPGDAGGVLTLDEDGATRSACAVLERELVGPGVRIKAGLIGSVATDPDHRGRGLATRLLADAEEELRARGCAIGLLWAEDDSFYLARGWRPAGWERDWCLDNRGRELLPEAIGVREATAADADALHALYRTHEARSERTLEEARTLLACPGMTTLVLEREGAPVAYACLGRGVDFPGVVHEWGGDAESVLALTRAHLERRFAADEEGVVGLIAPPTATDLEAALTDLGVPAMEGLLGLARVLDRAALGGLLAERVSPAGSVVVREDVRGAHVYLVGETCGVELDDDALLSLLLPARGRSEDVLELASAFGLSLGGLPLLPFCWGLDSI
jgi:GNAT superfamily N-acetyltransferase